MVKLEINDQSGTANDQVLSIQVLRCIAAVMVCFFHFTNGAPDYLLSSNIVKEIFRFGTYGVHVFFVISGFVLPYSLYKSDYTYKDFPKFFLKRLVRLEPPYFACIILVVVLGFVGALSPYYRGAPFVIDYYNLGLHLGYLNAFFSQGWINPVFWTLAIEFQFYLLLGLLFPYFKNTTSVNRYLLILIFLALSVVVGNSALIFHYITFFLIGIFTFLFHIGKISLREFCLFVLITSAFIFLQFFYHRSDFWYPNSYWNFKIESDPSVRFVPGIYFLLPLFTTCSNWHEGN